MTWHCRACGQVGRVLQVANLRPDPAPPVLEPEPERPRPAEKPARNASRAFSDRVRMRLR